MPGRGDRDRKDTEVRERGVIFRQRRDQYGKTDAGENGEHTWKNLMGYLGSPVGDCLLSLQRPFDI